MAPRRKIQRLNAASISPQHAATRATSSSAIRQTTSLDRGAEGRVGGRLGGGSEEEKHIVHDMNYQRDATELNHEEQHAGGGDSSLVQDGLLMAEEDVHDLGSYWDGEDELTSQELTDEDYGAGEDEENTLEAAILDSRRVLEHDEQLKQQTDLDTALAIQESLKQVEHNKTLQEREEAELELAKHASMETLEEDEFGRAAAVIAKSLEYENILFAGKFEGGTSGSNKSVPGETVNLKKGKEIVIDISSDGSDEDDMD